MTQANRPRDYYINPDREAKTEVCYEIEGPIEFDCFCASDEPIDSDSIHVIEKVHYTKAIKALKEAKQSLDWYRDVFNGPEHEFEHFWRVDLPHQIETTLQELGE